MEYFKLTICFALALSVNVHANAASSIKKSEPVLSPYQVFNRPDVLTARSDPNVENSQVPVSSLVIFSPLNSTEVKARPVQQTPRERRYYTHPVYSVKNAWGFSAGSSDSGPYLSGHSFISGRTLNDHAAAPKNDYPIVADKPTGRQVNTGTFFDSISPLMSSFAGNAVDAKSVLLGSLFTYGITNFGIPESMNSLIPMVRKLRSWWNKRTATKKIKEAEVVSNEIPEALEPAKKIGEEAEEDKVDEDEIMIAMEKKDSEELNQDETKKSRRKREIPGETDTDLAELVAMVVSAIQSGECMQRSICLMGSQIGASNKGRLAYLLLDKLIPESVQDNQYFVTMKKAIKGGESFCGRFRCRIG